jgi:hypothetical protein
MMKGSEGKPPRTRRIEEWIYETSVDNNEYPRG